MADSDSWITPSPIWRLVVAPGFAGRGRRGVVVARRGQYCGQGELARRSRTASSGQPVPRVSSPTTSRTDAPAKSGGLRVGDLLLAIDDEPVQRLERCLRSAAAMRTGRHGLRYTILRPGIARCDRSSDRSPRVRTAQPLYFVLARSACSRCSSAAPCGCAGRAIRRRSTSSGWPSPSSASSRSRSADGSIGSTGSFYWADVVAMLALPPLFLHFTLIFPERPAPLDRRRGRPGRRDRRPYVSGGRAWRLARMCRRCCGAEGSRLVVDAVVDVARPGAIRLSGDVRHWRAGRAHPRAVAGASITARRQLRWIAWGTALGGAPFALGYAHPVRVRRRDCRCRWSCPVSRSA